MTSSQQSRFQTYTRKLLSNTLTVVKDFDVTDLSTLDEFVGPSTNGMKKFLPPEDPSPVLHHRQPQPRAAATMAPGRCAQKKADDQHA